MKFFHRGAISLLFLVSFLGFGSAADTGNPQSVSVKIYEFWVSASTNCTSMTRVFNDTNPSYQNLVAGPTFGDMTVLNGTYHCVAWKMSDIITLVPDYTSTTSGACQQGQTYTRDLFRSPDVSISPTGTVINGSVGNSDDINEDFMWIYLSTNGDNNDAVTIPTEPGDIASPYIVSEDNDAILVADFTNGIWEIGGECSPEVVTFDFRYQN